MNESNFKGQRQRSPNYPYYDLRECVSLLDKLYKKYKGNEVHTEDAYIQMGFSPTSSTANRVLASLFSFGLLESRGTSKSKFVRPSRLGQEILLEEEKSQKRIELLQKATLCDSSMQVIYEKWGSIIPAEETIKKALQLEMNFSAEGAKRFATVIVETFNFAQFSELSSDKNSTIDEDNNKTTRESEDKKEEIISPFVRKANLLLTGNNREIIIYAPSDLTEDEFLMISKWLELQKYGLVSNKLR